MDDRDATPGTHPCPNAPNHAGSGDLAPPELIGGSRLSAERCQLAVLKGTDVLYLAIQVGRGPFRFAAGNRFEASPRY